MIGGLLKSASRLALVAAAGVVAGGVAAQAADLGGNCCADLEERVAELEATTARKGNRKVSLQVYGSISQMVMFWDDGAEKNAYVSENGSAKNTIGFRGSAKINADWSAGYRLEYQAKTASSDDVDQKPNGDEGVTSTGSLSLRHAAVYLQSASMGTLWIGQSDTASSGITTIDLSNSGAVNTTGGDFGASMLLRASGTKGDTGLSALAWKNVGTTWGSGYTGTSFSRRNVVRYITPTISGFSASASWGEDDTWDAALRYAGELGGFRIAAGVGYAQSSDETVKCSNGAASSSSNRDCHSVGGSASIMHVATGIFVNGSYAVQTDNNLQAAWSAGGFGGSVDKTSDHWTVAAGIEQKWFALGKTTIFGTYAKNELGGLTSSASGGALLTLGNSDALNGLGATAAVKSATFTSWGFGLVQQVDAAAMDLYIGYVHNSADITLQTAAGAVGKSRPIDDWQAVMTGATIKF